MWNAYHWFLPLVIVEYISTTIVINLVSFHYIWNNNLWETSQVIFGSINPEVLFLLNEVWCSFLALIFTWTGPCQITNQRRNTTYVTCFLSLSWFHRTNGNLYLQVVDKCQSSNSDINHATWTNSLPKIDTYWKLFGEIDPIWVPILGIRWSRFPSSSWIISFSR